MQRLIGNALNRRRWQRKDTFGIDLKNLVYVKTTCILNLFWLNPGTNVILMGEYAASLCYSEFLIL